MKYLSGEEISQYVSNIISKKKQVEVNCFHLTVKSIRQFTWQGHLDFGGSECIMAPTEVLRPQKKNEDEEYGWWYLQSGEYLVELNEKITIPESTVVIIQPLERLMMNGASHHALILEESSENIRLMLRVGSPGIALKENSRISKLIMLKVRQ